MNTDTSQIINFFAAIGILSLVGLAFYGLCRGYRVYLNKSVAAKLRQNRQNRDQIQTSDLLESTPCLGESGDSGWEFSYSYHALNASGHVTKGTVEAGSSEEAIRIIKSRGLYPTKVSPVAARK